MSVKIRLARGGRKSLPFYRIVVTDSRSPRDGKFIEKIGTYNPLLADDNETKIIVKDDRARYWLSVGALPTPRVAILLSKYGISEAEKHKVKFIPRKKGELKKSKKEE